MQITVACHRCEGAKRPLAPCPSCAAPAEPEAELREWRFSLHARGIARIREQPERVEPRRIAPRHLSPLRAVVVIDEAAPPETGRPAPIVPMEPAVPADQALSFDWGDAPRRLRRSA